MKIINKGNFEERKAAAIAKKVAALELGRQIDAFKRAMHNQRMEEDPEYAKYHAYRQRGRAKMAAFIGRMR